MAKMLEPIKALITPEMLQTVGTVLGLSPEQVKQGTEIVMPLLATGMARASATPEGQVALMKAVNEADTSVLGNLNGFLGGLTTSGGDDIVKRLLADDGRVVSALIKEKSGLDIGPLVGMAAPMVLGFLNSQVRNQGMDTAALMKDLKSASRSYERKEDESSVIVRQAFKAADEVRALKGQLSAAEMELLRAAPIAASARVIGASPSKEKAVKRELEAAVAAVDEAAAKAAPTSLVAALFADGAASISAASISDTPAALKSAMVTLSRVSPSEAESYRKLIIGAAYAAASEVKEGGFLGVGAKAVSADEQRSIDTISAALGAA